MATKLADVIARAIREMPELAQGYAEGYARGQADLAAKILAVLPDGSTDAGAVSQPSTKTRFATNRGKRGEKINLLLDVLQRAYPNEVTGRELRDVDPDLHLDALVNGLVTKGIVEKTGTARFRWKPPVPEEPHAPPNLGRMRR